MKEDKSGAACYTYGGEVECIRVFLWRNLKGRGQLRDISVDWRILLKWISLKGLSFVELTNEVLNS
jgi:hypothetical protein